MSVNTSADLPLAAGAVAASTLLEDPILQSCSKIDIARLLNHVAHRLIEPGEILFKEGDGAGTVYLIEEGEFNVSCNGEHRAEKTSGFLGLEGLVGHAHYGETAVAGKKAAVICFPLASLEAITSENVKILKRFFHAYERRHTETSTSAISKPAAAKVKSSTVSHASIIGWLLVSIVPFLLYYLGQRAGIDPKILYFSGIIADAVIMWVFDLVPAFVPPLFSILLIILFDVAQPKVALSGFSSGTFFMCLSIFGISALMTKSGLAYRLSLNLLLLVPPTRSWCSFILFFLGALLSPIVPSRNGRLSIAGSFLVELMGMIKAGKRDERATQFMVSAMYGAALMTPVFLTGSSLNLIMYGMFDEQNRYTYQWLYWLLVASVPGLLLFGAFVVVSGIFFRSAGQVQISKDVIREQKRIIGPMSRMEFGTLLTILSLVVLIPTLKLHKVDIPWLMLTVSTILLIFGMIGQKEFRSAIDWPILILIGAVLAWTPVISLIGLDSVIASALSEVASYMKSEFHSFVAILCLAVVVARLFLPIQPVVIIFATITLPIAIGAGMSPWPIAFILLTMSDATIFPYQNLLHLQLDGSLAQHSMKDALDDAKILWFEVLMIALRVAVIYASIPFWKYLNVL